MKNPTLPKPSNDDDMTVEELALIINKSFLEMSKDLFRISKRMDDVEEAIVDLKEEVYEIKEGLEVMKRDIRVIKLRLADINGDFQNFREKEYIPLEKRVVTSWLN